MLRTALKLGLSGVAGAVLLSVAPASAQITGTVNVTGFVAASCSTATSLTGTIPLGSLAKADGTVNTALTGATNFRVNCTGTAPKVSLTATSMGNTAPAPAGFANTVRFDAHMNVDMASGPAQSFVYHTASGTGTATSPTTLPGAIAAPTAGDNIHITVDTLSTASPTDLLVSGNYGVGLGGTGGVITFTISNS